MTKAFVVAFFKFIPVFRGIAFLVFSIVFVIVFVGIIIRELIKNKQKEKDDTAEVVDSDQNDPN